VYGRRSRIRCWVGQRHRAYSATSSTRNHSGERKRVSSTAKLRRRREQMTRVSACSRLTQDDAAALLGGASTMVRRSA
jgi:hypothetical protein